jgi:hypothetical protein
MQSAATSMYLVSPSKPPNHSTQRESTGLYCTRRCQSLRLERKLGRLAESQRPTNSRRRGGVEADGKQTGEGKGREAERRTVDVLGGGGVDGEAAAPGGRRRALEVGGGGHCVRLVAGRWGFGLVGGSATGGWPPQRSKLI